MEVRTSRVLGKGLQRLIATVTLALVAATAGAAPTPQTQPPPPPPSYTPGSPDEPAAYTVMLIVDISGDGSITKVELEKSSGFADLDKAAMEAAAGWNLKHAVTAGKPMRARLPVSFPVDAVAAKHKAEQNP